MMRELDSLILMILKLIVLVVNTGEEKVKVPTCFFMRRLRKHPLDWNLKILSNSLV